MDFLLQSAGKLMSALNLLGIPLTNPIGFSAELDAERKEWLETSSRDSILADLTRCILYNRPSGKRAVFTSTEAVNLESIFAAHANRNNCWDQESLELYLLTQIPNDEEYRALLTNCVPSLWKLITYFSQWPFISSAPSAGTACSSTTRLPFHALVRAIAFLSGRHSIMFARFDEERNADVPRRTDRLALEHIFRAFAIDAGQETTTASSTHSLHDDVLDTLNTVQPVLNEFTTPMNRERLVPLAIRLLPPPGAPAPAALSSFTMPTAGSGGVFALLDLFVSLLQYASKFDTTGIPVILIKDLETARVELQNADGISFEAFIKWLGDDDLNVYDAVALLFNTFPNPKSLTDGITTDFTSGDGMSLFLYALRRPGLRLVSS